MRDGEWKFNRGSLKAHYIVEGKAVCGSGSKYEPACIDIEDKYKCSKCKAKLREGSGTK
jgi:hypothetical protein